MCLIVDHDLSKKNRKAFARKAWYQFWKIVDVVGIGRKHRYEAPCQGSYAYMKTVPNKQDLLSRSGLIQMRKRDHLNGGVFHGFDNEEQAKTAMRAFTSFRQQTLQVKPVY